MKVIPLVLAGFTVLYSFSSCKKENSASTDTSADLPKTYTEDVTSPANGHEVETYNLTFDGNKRLTSMISTTPDLLKFIYTYNSDKSFTLDLYESGQLTIHSLYLINAIGLVDSNFQYNNTQDTSTEKYIYNASKQLIQNKEYEYSTATGSVLWNSTQYAYDGNGNMITKTEGGTTTSIEYYPDLEVSFTLDGAYFPHSKNLPKTETVNSGGSIITITHTYTFDSQNRLTSEKLVADNGEIAIKSYGY
jgi:YD repeat-containing protein